jgi:nucleotide-binding universal stress UspA family protein
VHDELEAVRAEAPVVAREGRCLHLTGDEAVLATVAPGGLAVVGTHGRPGPLHRVLGSVSHEVVVHAAVPVVAIH